MRLAHLLDQFQLLLDPIDVALLRGQDLFHQITAAVVAQTPPQRQRITGGRSGGQRATSSFGLLSVRP